MNQPKTFIATLLIVVPFLVILTSCRKKTADNPTPLNTIMATVDGINKTFNAKVIASQTNLGGTSVLIISGAETSETNSGAIAIEIDTTAIIREGTYPVKPGIPNGFNSRTVISYNEGFASFFPSSNTAAPNSITISHISSTNVQGTFNATLSGGALGTASPDKTFTNGKFNVTIKQSN